LYYKFTGIAGEYKFDKNVTLKVTENYCTFSNHSNSKKDLIIIGQDDTGAFKTMNAVDLLENGYDLLILDARTKTISGINAIVNAII
jgi:hypothetical protein